MDAVRVKINYCLIGSTATISSEYKTFYNLVLGENSGDYLLSVVSCFSIKTGQCDMELGAKLEVYAVAVCVCADIKIKSGLVNHPFIKRSDRLRCSPFHRSG